MLIFNSLKLPQRHIPTELDLPQLDWILFIRHQDCHVIMVGPWNQQPCLRVRQVGWQDAQLHVAAQRGEAIWVCGTPGRTVEQDALVTNGYPVAVLMPVCRFWFDDARIGWRLRACRLVFQGFIGLGESQVNGPVKPFWADAR